MNLPRRSAWLRVALCAGAFAMLTRRASAHAGLPGVGDLWNGTLHLVLDPEQGLAFLALGLGMARVQTSGKKSPFAIYHVGLALGLIAGYTLFPPGAEKLGPVPMAAAGIVLIDPGGLLSRWPNWTFGAAAFLTGLSFGAEIMPETSSFVFAAGTYLGATLLPLYPAALWERFYRPWFLIAVRIMGSWLAAIAIILIGASFRKG